MLRLPLLYSSLRRLILCSNSLHFLLLGGGASPLLAVAAEGFDDSLCSSFSFLRKCHKDGWRVPTGAFHLRWKPEINTKIVFMDYRRTFLLDIKMV